MLTRGTRLSVFVNATSFSISKKEMYIPLRRFQKKAPFAGDVSINWATGRRWKVKLLDTWQVTQVNLPRQESVKEIIVLIVAVLPEHCVLGLRQFLFVGCLMSQQHASISQGRICSDNFTCCHTEIEVADQTFYLTQSQYADTSPTSPSADPITPGA